MELEYKTISITWIDYCGCPIEDCKDDCPVLQMLSKQFCACGKQAEFTGFFDICFCSEECEQAAVQSHDAWAREQGLI